MPAIGEVIAERYRLEEQLGVGAMGSVWRAAQIGADTDVAIKIIHRAAAHDARSLARFERESRLAAKIHSDHVVRVLDHGHHDGLPFIVMDCLRGEDLRHRLEARKKLSIHETGEVVRQVARALEAAHGIGLVHRDLKPENIFISPPTGNEHSERIRILDFGVAKVSDTIGLSGLDPTRTGALVGTPYYLSPEQARGLKTVGPPADLWSLAVVAFECITGERPFSGSAMGPLIAKITHGVIPVPSELQSDVPPALDVWFRKAMTREPEGRFARAAEMAASFPAALVPSAPLPPHVLPDRTIVVDEEPPMARTMSDAAVTIALESRIATPTDAARTITVDEHPPPVHAPPAAPHPGMDTLLRAPWPVAPPKRRGPGIAIGIAAVVLVGGAGTYLIASGGSSAASATGEQREEPASPSTDEREDVLKPATSAASTSGPSTSASVPAPLPGASATPTTSARMTQPPTVKPWKYRTTLQ